MVAINVQENQNYLMMNLKGEIIASNFNSLEKSIQNYLNRSVPIWIFNLAQVPFMDEAGLGCLLFLKRFLESQERKIYLVGITEELVKVFKVTGLFRDFETFASLGELLEKHHDFQLPKKLNQ